MVKIDISNRALFVYGVLIVLFLGIGFGVAFGGNEPTVMGHSAGEIEGVAFGGMYEAGNHNTVGPECETANPLTGDCSCPDGFIDASFSKTCEGTAGCPIEWDQTHFCYK